MSAGLPLMDDGARNAAPRTVNPEKAAPAPAAMRKCRRDREFFMVKLRC